MTKLKTFPDKLVPFNEISMEDKAKYQREQRITEKAVFRAELEQILGSDFTRIVKSITKYGITCFKDFVSPDIFDILIKEYDALMRKGGASSDTFKFNFANLFNNPEFLLNKSFKDAFFHPLLIALIAYQTGGPVRLVDARAKNAQSEETMVRDNGPHLDDNPFSDEWKLLVSWSITDEGISLNHGPQGQPFVSLPGTEVLVRKRASEYGANFKNPAELLQLLESDSLKQNVFAIEAKDQRPLFVIFEASHQIHHRKRSKEEPGRACYIESFHIVSPTNNPPPYFTGVTQNLVRDPLDRFILCGEGDHDYFLRNLFAKKEEIIAKMQEINKNKLHIEAHQKMMNPIELVRYFKLLISTYQRETIHSRKNLRFTKAELLTENISKITEKLRTLIGERDKHHDLDLVVYSDLREQIRKIPRTKIRESTAVAVDNTRFKNLVCPPLPDSETILTVDIGLIYAKKIQQLGMKLQHILYDFRKNKNLPIEFSTLLDCLFSSEFLPEEKVSKLLASFRGDNPILAEIVYLFQLTKDITEAFNQPEDIQGLRANIYFLYLVYDYVLQIPYFSNNQIIENYARNLLQEYFNFVILDDLTYEKYTQQFSISDDILFERISDILIKEESNIDTNKHNKIEGAIPFSESLLFKSYQKQFPNEAKIFDKIKISENTLYKAMLEEAAKNEDILKVLTFFIRLFYQEIFSPLFISIEKCLSLEDLPAHIKASIEYLIDEHSQKNYQRLGLMNNIPRENIINNKKAILILLNGIENRLKQLNHLLIELTGEDIEKAIKSMNELAFCYLSFFPHNMDNRFYISESIMPSEEEDIARITRSSVERNFKKSEFMSGKNVFHTVSLFERGKIEVNTYDKYTDLLKQGNVLNLEQLNLLENAKKFMLKYNIPLDLNKRMELSNYLQPSSIESISRLASSDGAFPLIAGASRTVARTLRTLYELGAFDNADGSFNFNYANIAANLVVAMLGIGEHHSFIEMVEIYNRLLAAAGINALEEGFDTDARLAQTKQFPVVNINQHMIPHFFNLNYRSSIINRAINIEEKENMPILRSRL